MPAFAQISKRLARVKGQDLPPGRFSFGTQLFGGPRTTDAFGARRAPSLLQLAENYNALIYAMVARNRNAVARLPMRLLADGSRVQGKPSRACDPIKISREVGKQLAESGQVSTAAIDQIYEIRNHPLLDCLDHPDPYGTFTREQFIGLIVSYFDVFGDAYVVPEGNGWDWRKPQRDTQKGPPDFLWVVYPQYTIPIRLAASPIVEWFQYFSDRLPRDAVLRIRHNHSLRDAYGASFSPTYASEPYRQQEQEQVAILSQVLGIGPRPNLIATSKDPMMQIGDKEAEALRQDMIRMHSAGNAGGLLVNTGAFDFTPVSYSPADLAGLELSKQDVTMIAAIFDQPPTYYTVESNIANLTAADAQHDKMGVQPRCKTVAGAFTRLAKQYDPRLMFKFDPGLPDDELVKAQVDKIYFDAGAITINEWGEEKRYAKKPWGDEPLIADNMLPLSKILEAHDQTMMQGQQEMEFGDQQLESGEQSDVLAADQHGHQKKMDKEKLKIENKKASQKPARPAVKRSIEAEVETVLRDIQAQLMAFQETK